MIKLGVSEVRRTETAELLLQEALKHKAVHLTGPAHWGKSWLLQNELQCLADQNMAGCSYLDLFSLRRASIEALDREATRWLFREQEDQFQRFRQRIGAEGAIKDSLLHRYLDEHVPDGGMLILDHLEKLPLETVTTQWLEALFDYLEERQVRLVVAERTLGADTSRLAQFNYHAVEFRMPLLDEKEIEQWIAGNDHLGLLPRGIGPGAVKGVTGGLVGLLRDLGIWLASERRDDNDPISGFTKAQSQKYSASCQEILNAFVNYPLEVGSWRSKLPDPLKKKLLISGIFSESNTGVLKPLSPVHDQRLESLLNKDGLLVGASDIRTLKSGAWPIEVQALSLTRTVNSAPSFGHAIKNITDFFQAERFQAEFWLRDQNHPLIWRKALPGIDDLRKVRRTHARTLKHGYAKDEPFFQVMRHARRHPAIPGKSEAVWYPLIGVGGKINLVVVVSAQTNPSSRSAWSRMIWSRSIGHLLDVVEPALANKAEEFSMRCQVKAFNDLRAQIDSRTIDFSDSEFKEVLTEAKSQAVAVLIPSPQHDINNLQWTVGLFHSACDADSHVLLQATDLLTGQGHSRLSDIAADPFSRGLVVEGDDALAIFPGIQKQGTISTLYLKPVRVKEEGGNPNIRLVVFVYYSENNRILDGRTQNHLAILSQRLSYVDFLKFRWGQEHEQELAVLTDIGRAMSESLFDPKKAITDILRSLRDFFKVSAISINQKVRYEEGNETRTQVRIFHGIGYDDPYLDVVYPVGEGLDEGKTGLIARTGITLVSWQKPTNNEIREEFRLDEKSGTLLPFNVSVQGADRCSRYVKEKRVCCYLGVPIVWTDPETGDREILGMLQMVNRTRPGDQRFSTRKIAAARRIADLLAPALFLVRERSRFGAQARLKTMATLFRGLDHELINYLMDIRWAADLLNMVTREKTEQEWISQIHTAVGATKQRIDAIKGLALSDAGKPKRISIQGFLTENYFDGRHKWPPTIRVDCDDVCDKAIVYIDPDRLILALDNLLENAKEALQAVQFARIKISAKRIDGESVELVVTDNGPGVPEHIKDDVFEPFVSWHDGVGEIPIADPNRMRGIGLALVRAVAENSGGEAIYRRVRNETCFCLTLPAG